MKPNQIAQLGLKRMHIIVVNKKNQKSDNFIIPDLKVEAVNNAIKNTNLLQILDKYVNENH
ncbi:MAG TPA: hypothetical protein VK169_06900 [Saprospiraceae bacterium]|nr:hypothetical protein [Saprospiraceae bacterium]